MSLLNPYLNVELARMHRDALLDAAERHRAAQSMRTDAAAKRNGLHERSAHVPQRAVFRLSTSVAAVRRSWATLCHWCTERQSFPWRTS